MNWALIITGLLVGFMFGFVLQHGRFCMNTAFREVLLSRDFTVFRAYILALLIVIVGANFLADPGAMGLLGMEPVIHLRSIPFTWVANILGGYIFGIGMVIGGGCATGTLYRIGEGMIGSWFAALGFMLTAAATTAGFLNPIAKWFWFGPGFDPSDPASAKFMYMLTDAEGESLPVTLFNIIGVNRWLVIVLIAVPAIIFVSKGRFKKPETQKGFIWWSSGLMIGIIGIIAFYTSEVYGGFSQARGLSFTGPLNEMVAWFTGSATTGTFREIASYEEIEIGALATAGTITWSVYMIIGLVLGSLTSAMGSKEFGWRAPKAQTLVTQFCGGLLMGFGGVLAGGCNIGHGFSGMATLALGSLLSLIFIILGSWTLVYFLFIRE